MNVDIIKSYCQFCLKQQTKDHPKIPISRDLKQNFQDLTHLKVKKLKKSFNKIQQIIFKFSAEHNKIQ